MIPDSDKLEFYNLKIERFNGTNLAIENQVYA